MKICILGPVRTAKHIGGVASFTEGLYQGFRARGDDAVLLSFSSSSTLSNPPVKRIKENSFSPIVHAGVLAKAIEKEKPDLVIASMMYGDGIRQFKKAWPKATYIMVLHGFPIAAIYGSLKTNFLNNRFRRMARYFDHMVANSAFSSAINEQFYRIHCDAVINLASDMDPDYSIHQRPYEFVYVGRLVADKKIDLISEAFLSLCATNPDLKMAVAGSGPLAQEFVSGKYRDSHIDFTGPLSSGDVASLLSRSRYFISLCGTESFGIAFVEAAKRGCRILCPKTGGQIEFLSEYSFAKGIDASSSKVIAMAMDSAVKTYQPISVDELKEFNNRFSYKRVADNFAELALR